MAKSLFLADGSVRLIFSEDDQKIVLAGLIREYLGTDCEELFHNLIEEGKNPRTDTGDDFEKIADGYLDMLRDTLEELDAMLTLFSSSRLDRRKLHAALQRCRNNIYNNL